MKFLEDGNFHLHCLINDSEEKTNRKSAGKQYQDNLWGPPGHSGSSLGLFLVFCFLVLAAILL